MDPRAEPEVVLLSGGLGGARLAPALANLVSRLTVIANVGDDFDWLGLRVSPDVDSVTYALAGVWDANRGWGRADETFHARDALASFGAELAWFGVGDRDLALHLLRTTFLRQGRSLTQATERCLAALGVSRGRVLPASDEVAETMLVLADGRTVHFQEWYVREGAEPRVREVRDGRGRAAPAAIDALARARSVVLAPSNPVSSIGAILALDGIRAAVCKVPVRIAVSPVVLGVEPGSPSLRHRARARGRLLEARGVDDTPSGIARLYAGVVDDFLLDSSDRSHETAVAEAGLRPVVAEILDDGALARAIRDRIGAVAR